MNIAAAPAPRTLADVVPMPGDRTLRIAREAALVGGFAVLTAVFAQIKITLGFTPVPITGQTFAVLLAGAALGWKRGLASQALYWAVGMLVPFAWYADGTHGWEVATGTTAGYLAGFVVSGAIVGYLAERGQDRTIATSIPAMLAGTAAIYTLGALWLAHKADIAVTGEVGTDNAIAWGVTPFLVGDAVKMLAAGLLTPLAWRGIERFRR